MATIRPFRYSYPDVQQIYSVEEFLKKTKQYYPILRDEGFFVQSAEPAVLAYRQEGEGKIYTGIIATIDIEEYLNNTIVKHELTLAAKEMVMTDLVLERQATIKPVIITHPKSKKCDVVIDNYMSQNAPTYSLKIGDITHTFWAMPSGKVLDDIMNYYKNDIDKMYIADGHHRMSITAYLYHKHKNNKEKYRYIMAGLFSFDVINIYEYNRVVNSLNKETPKSFLAKLKNYFLVEKKVVPLSPQRKNVIGMYLNGEWYALQLLPNILSSYTEEPVLDVSLLNDIILTQILGYSDIRNNALIDYVEGPRGLKALEQLCLVPHNSVAFSLYPVSVDDFIEVADASKILPPKSTWFEPRLQNGMIIHPHA
jgi:uncharacterized protein (DUF1015 family)